MEKEMETHMTERFALGRLCDKWRSVNPPPPCRRRCRRCRGCRRLRNSLLASRGPCGLGRCRSPPPPSLGRTPPPPRDPPPRCLFCASLDLAGRRASLLLVLLVRLVLLAHCRRRRPSSNPRSSSLRRQRLQRRLRLVRRGGLRPSHYPRALSLVVAPRAARYPGPRGRVCGRLIGVAAGRIPPCRSGRAVP